MANAASSASSLGAGPSSSLPPPPPSALPEELIEEILLRFPPGEPASLLRAALVCKRWRPLVSGPGFRRRFGEFHRTPPMLGMFCSGCSRVYRHFEPTTAFRPCHAERAHKRVLDARHGRVLLRGERRALVVWNPITDEARKVPLPRSPPQYMGPLTWTAAVLCSSAGAGGCDHLDCHHGPFIVVVVRSAFGTAGVVETLIFTYSSDVAAWSEPICDQLPAGYIRGLVDPHMRSALVGNALYFGFMEERTALTYNMQLHQMSWIQLPPSGPVWPGSRGLRLLHCSVMSAAHEPIGANGRREKNGFGEQCSVLSAAHEPIGEQCESHRSSAKRGQCPFVGFCSQQRRMVDWGSPLNTSPNYVWWRKDADEVDARWEQSRVIEELKMLLPVDLGIIFMRAGNAIYAIDLKTYKGKKVCQGKINTIVPYMSFYTPALEADGTGDGPSAGGSSA